ncbi:hypothetical protein QQS21_001676 [Conoideocrella luteorostrata]|uniref:Uncharacterized protein n=1 Tax=Conoideocrella luteorostrata TaxID=1105319 RepID=A0AAJ0CWJ0_9HYPO|nr:hypothetical protein QQS21_001676 [Conoideocrella luteorostrata]
MAENIVNTKKMQYTDGAIKFMKTSGLDPALENDCGEDPSSQLPFIDREWSSAKNKPYNPRAPKDLMHNIGPYPLTSGLARWVTEAFQNYGPSVDAENLVQPFSAEFHEFLEKERATSTGFHNLGLVELVYQISLEVGADILIAATAMNKSNLDMAYHSSRTARDEHFAVWGKLLTGLECDPPIISQFPIYLMMCQSFSFETNASQENYVYSTMCGIDWVKGKSAYSDRFKAYKERAHKSIPRLNDKLSGEDMSFWRISSAYLDAINKTENSRNFTAPNQSFIKTNMDPHLLIAARAFDGGATAFMCRDGAAFFDNQGMDSLIGSTLPNDVMDLHTDIMTGETRNLLRLLYPNNLNIEQNLKTMSTVFSGMLCELFRGHKRARFCGREDGCVAATSPPYSLSRARHRRVFEIMEAYVTKYPQFWDWTWGIYNSAKSQVTEAGLGELLVTALCRSVSQGILPNSAPNKFFDSYFGMVEHGGAQWQDGRPLGVHGDLGQAIYDIHSLWHDQLLATDKEPGWGRTFDKKSDVLFGRVGEIFSARGGITDEVFEFAIAYGHLSMGLPYIAYHAIDAIILSYGATSTCG